METPKRLTETGVIREIKSIPGIKMEEQPIYEIPTIFDYSGFESAYPNQTEHVRRELAGTVEACKEFLSGVVITDEFTSRDQRREWRHHMFAKYGSTFVRLYGKNKLRLNNIASLHGWFSLIGKAMTTFKVGGEDAEKIKDVVARFPDIRQYDDSLPLEEKISLVKKIDAVCVDLLNLLKADGRVRERPSVLSETIRETPDNKELFKNFYSFVVREMPEGIPMSEHSYPIRIGTNELQAVMFGLVEENRVAVGLFLRDGTYIPKETIAGMSGKYARRTLEIDSNGDVREDPVGIIPDYDLTENEPDFSGLSDEDIAAETIRQILSFKKSSLN